MTPTTNPQPAAAAMRIADLERTIAERDRRIAELEPLARLATTLQRIATAQSWPARDRAILAALIATCQTAGDSPAPVKASAAKVAEWAGVSERTARDALIRFSQVGIIGRHVQHETVNRFGKSINVVDADPDRGDRWQTNVMLEIPAELAELPDLPDTPHLARARVEQKARRDELAALRELKKLVCPHCGTTGEWHLTCDACGAILHTADADADAQPDADPANFAGYPATAADDGQAPTLQTLQGICTYPANSAADTLREEADGAHNPETTPESVQDPHPANFAAPENSGKIDLAGYYLTGSDTIIHLADEGAAFCLIEPTKEPRGKCPINPIPADDDTADPIPWPDCPMTAAAARAHLARGNVGVLTGRGALAIVDCDAGLPDLLAAWPELAAGAVVYRPDAPDRAKFIVKVDGPMPASRTCAAGGRKAEILAAGRQGVIAGTHASGAEIRFKIAPLLTVTAAELDARLAGFVALPSAAPLDPHRTIEARMTRPPLPSVQSEPTTNRAANHAGDTHARILEWCKDPANQAAVDRLLAGCKRAGKYYAIRPDDTTPSLTRRTDADGRRIYRDFGAGVTYDDFEIYCELTGQDKRQVIREMLAQ